MDVLFCFNFASAYKYYGYIIEHELLLLTLHYNTLQTFTEFRLFILKKI